MEWTAAGIAAFSKATHGMEKGAATLFLRLVAAMAEARRAGRVEARDVVRAAEIQKKGKR